MINCRVARILERVTRRLKECLDELDVCVNVSHLGQVLCCHRPLTFSSGDTYVCPLTFSCLIFTVDSLALEE